MVIEHIERTLSLRKIYKTELLLFLGFIPAFVVVGLLMMIFFPLGAMVGVLFFIGYVVTVIVSLVKSIVYFCSLLGIDESDELSAGEKDALRQLRTISIVAAITGPFFLVNTIAKIVFMFASKAALKNKI